MAEAQQQLVRLNVPNQLGAKETHETLRAWETKVKTYFSRDVLFRKFFGAGECANWEGFNQYNCFSWKSPKTTLGPKDHNFKLKLRKTVE